jgi:phosphoribosylformylglycinamidine synthase
VEDELTMGTLVRACEACRDAAIAFGIPFISGKDSLHNQFTNSETGEVIRIPSTLLISAMGIVEDVRRCVTMDFKTPGNQVCLVSAKDPKALKSLSATHRAMSAAIAAGGIAAAHDVSDGGIAVAAAEMCIASGLGLAVRSGEVGFEERPGQYLVEFGNKAGRDQLKASVGDVADLIDLGTVQHEPLFAIAGYAIPVSELTKSWRGTLDW